ncbi:MAG: flagellar hook-basal body complex protein FliE [Deltaproteobacteria bacterium]|nr:flagellar hook-basal body complex protein FliE [Deltaproteobacteria bacterium]
MQKITLLNKLEVPDIAPLNNGSGEKQDATDFGEMLTKAIDKVDQLNQEADQAVRNLATGQDKDIHNTMIALEKAEISFRLMMQVRNKIVTAYQEVMRMQV